MENKANMLGVAISAVTKEQALEKVVGFLGLPAGRQVLQKQYKIFTPNPEMIVKAQKDQYFKKVLNTGDVNLCDGFGLQIFTGIKRIPGIDFMLEICRAAAEQGKSIFLLGSGVDEIVKKTMEELSKKFPNIKIVGYDKGPNIDEWRAADYELKLNLEENNALIHKINALSPDILFVAFGMGKQEKWIHEYLAKIPSVNIAMGVGGSFDFIAGKVKRAPLFLRQIGLEWAYRLWQEPERIDRIFNATIRFVFLICKQRLWRS
jgi:N-acetylglucosaminyldiphosphoundecaprenol N-acetyl-beta-D-mannosaminyltransferase